MFGRRLIEWLLKKGVSMFKKLVSILIVAVLTISTSGCVSIYRKAVFPYSTMDNFPEQPITKNNVALAVHFFDINEARSIFDAETIKREVQPVYVILENNSDTTYYLKKSSMTPRHIPARIAAKKCAYWTMMKQVASIPFLILPPLGIAMMVTNGVTGGTANNRIESDFESNELKDSRIMPNSSLKGVLFMPLFLPGDNLTIPLTTEDAKQNIVFEFQSP